MNKALNNEVKLMNNMKWNQFNNMGRIKYRKNDNIQLRNQNVNLFQYEESDSFSSKSEDEFMRVLDGDKN